MITNISSIINCKKAFKFAFSTKATFVYQFNGTASPDFFSGKIIKSQNKDFIKSHLRDKNNIVNILWHFKNCNVQSISNKTVLLAEFGNNPNNWVITKFIRVFLVNF